MVFSSSISVRCDAEVALIISFSNRGKLYQSCRSNGASTALEERADVLGRSGIDMHTVTSFVINNGLKSVPTCTDPRPRDLATRFDTTVKRHRNMSFVKLSPEDVFVVAKVLPIIAMLIPYWSFRRRSKSIYHGPTKREVENKNSFKLLHDVLIVGLTKIRRGNKVEKFVIIQNSWGSRFGVSGSAIVLFDCENLFVEFFAPYGHIRDQDPQGMASSSASSNPSRKYFGSSVETGDIGIPSDHVEHHSPHTWYNAKPDTPNLEPQLF